MRWQTRVRAVLGLAILVLAGGVGWYVMQQRPQAGPPPMTPRTDAAADTEIKGDEFIRMGNDNKVVFRLKYEHGFIYNTQNRVRLMKASGLMMRGDQPVEFRADEADIKLKSGALLDFDKFDEMTMKGNVVIRSGPGTDVLLLETSEAAYNDLTGVMTTDKPITVRKGPMSGSGTGATFDRNRSVVWILADSKVTIATEGQGRINVTASRAGLAEADKYMRFEENVRMEKEGRVIHTDAAVANLTPDLKRVTVLELRGKSRITGGSKGDGGVPNMNADDITINHGVETGLLERAVLMRGARVELPEGGGKSLAAEFIDLGFAADGKTVTVLDATDAVELKIPAAGGDPARDVRAPKLEGRGSPSKGLERAQFTGGVEFRELAPAQAGRGAIDRVGRSESMVFHLDGGFDKISNADFSGNVRFSDRDLTGEAPDARYAVDAKRITLRGGGGNARVTQEDGTIDAKDIDLTLDPRRLSAKGNVRSTLKPGARKDRKDARPSILEDDQPVNVTSRTLEYDDAAERAVYTGDARLWQGKTVIQAETIVLDDKTGNLEARKNMSGRFLIKEDPQPGQKPRDAAMTEVSADEMTYDESRRQATFRGNAKMNGPEGNISANRIEIFLREDGNTLDRAEGYEKVTAHLEGGREATGDRLKYHAGTRMYEMYGKPLVVTRKYVDKNAGNAVKCETMQGASLTFNRSTEQISVSGASGAPSRTVPIPCSAIK